MRAQQEGESSTQQALDETIIRTLEPIGSGCETEGCPEDGAAEEGVSPRKKPNPSPNNKLSTPPSTEEENVDDLDEENDPGHEPPQESKSVERRTVDRFLPEKDLSKGGPAKQPLLLEREDPDEEALSCAGEGSDRSSQSGSRESFTVDPQLGDSWTLRAGEDIGGSMQKNGLAWHCVGH